MFGGGDGDNIFNIISCYIGKNILCRGEFFILIGEEVLDWVEGKEFYISFEGSVDDKCWVIGVNGSDIILFCDLCNDGEGIFWVVGGFVKLCLGFGEFERVLKSRKLGID